MQFNRQPPHFIGFHTTKDINCDKMYVQLLTFPENILSLIYLDNFNYKICIQNVTLLLI